mmetsp:Transcript_3185/g.6589  ORF Transcript_3185/g.6589 Transcript_3185/m.6589 type:complete len:200 (+) Transcript_3185:274-873(+)
MPHPFGNGRRGVRLHNVVPDDQRLPPNGRTQGRGSDGTVSLRRSRRRLRGGPRRGSGRPHGRAGRRRCRQALARGEDAGVGGDGRGEAGVDPRGHRADVRRLRRGPVDHVPVHRGDQPALLRLPLHHGQDRRVERRTPADGVISTRKHRNFHRLGVPLLNCIFTPIGDGSYPKNFFCSTEKIGGPSKILYALHKRILTL